MRTDDIDKESIVHLFFFSYSYSFLLLSLCPGLNACRLQTVLLSAVRIDPRVETSLNELRFLNGELKYLSILNHLV